MTSDAKFRNWRKSPVILERSSYEENFTYHLKYPISQNKKTAALENVMQFLEFLTVHNSCFRCLDKNQRRDREP